MAKNDFSKVVKKTDGRVILYIICFALAFALGYLVLSFFTKTDEFILKADQSGKIDMVLNVGDEYIEYGASCISFGKDESGLVERKYYYRVDEYTDYVECESVDTSTSGIYYVEYKTTSFKYSGVTLIRAIVVNEVEGVV